MPRSGQLLFTLAALGLAAAPACATVGADGFEDLKLLDQRVVGALNADIGTPGGPAAPIDSRLKLRPCPEPATIDPPALGAVAIRCPAVGWRIRVPLVRSAPSVAAAAGAPAAAALQPAVIKRGDPVELSASSTGFSVTTEGVAQEDGRIGGTIRVKTDARGPVLLGQVIATGRVRVASF